jgi:hypothetical protein
MQIIKEDKQSNFAYEIKKTLEDIAVLTGGILVEYTHQNIDFHYLGKTRTAAGSLKAAIAMH